MLSLFKANSYKIGDQIFDLDGGALPARFWHQKGFGTDGSKINTIRVSEYGRVIRCVRNATSLEEIYSFLEDAYEHPELMCLYSGIQKTYENIFMHQDTQLLRPTKEFFSIEATTTNIVAIDIDNWPVKQGISVTDIDRCGEYILEQLCLAAPEIFSPDSGYVIKASSSCGMKDGLNYHLFFINDEPICISQIKTIIKNVNSSLDTTRKFADPSVYSPGRLWYTAKPNFLDPNMYPFLNREHMKIKIGREITIPTTTELDKGYDVSSLNIDSIKSYFKNFVGIDPTTESLDPKIVSILEQIKSGDISDLVWSKHSLHLIFLAISNGYNLEIFLDKILRPVLTEYAAKKHVRVDRYLEKLDFALKYATSTVLRQISKEVLQNRKIMSPVALANLEILEVPANAHGYLSLPQPFPEKNTINFIKSSLGTGKTTTVKNLIDEGKLKNVITITNRVSLVNSNARKLGLTSYKEMGTFSSALDTSGGLSVCLNSLSRKDIAENIFANKYDTLFIDEADSVMYDLVNASTIPDLKRDSILDCLQHLLNNCSHIILADGDMSCETIEAYSQLSLFKSKVFITTTETHSGVHVYEYLKEGEMHGALISELEASYEFNEATLVVSDYGPAKIREMSYILEAAMSAVGKPIRVLQIHDESKNDDDVRALLLDPTAPMNYDLVFTSPSVTSGIDFQGRFANVFCYTTQKVNTPNIRLQAICRERRPQHVYIHTGRLVESAWVDPKYFRGYNERAQGFIEKVRSSYIQRDLVECEKYRFYIRYNMLIKGITAYEVTSSLVEFSELWDELRVKYKEEHKSIYIERILNASLNQELKTMNKIGLLKKEILAFADISEDELTYDIVEAHLENKPATKAKNLHALSKITPLWNELSALKSDIRNTNKEKTLKDIFLRYLPEIRKTGAFVNLEFPASTLKAMGFHLTLTPSKRIYTWDDEEALNNYRIYLDLYELESELVKPPQIDEVISEISTR